MNEFRTLDACVVGEYLASGAGAIQIFQIVNSPAYQCWLHVDNLQEYCDYVYQLGLNQHGNAGLAQQAFDLVEQQAMQWAGYLYNAYDPTFIKSVSNLIATQGFTPGEASIVALTKFLSHLPGKLVTTDTRLATEAGKTVAVELVP